MNNIEKLAIERDHLKEIKEACDKAISLGLWKGDATIADVINSCIEIKTQALQSSEPVAAAVYEIYAGLDNWREVPKAEYDDYKRTKRMLVPANANDFCYAELQAVYDEMYVHKDVARVANQLYKLIHSRTLPPSTVSLEEHNNLLERIAELEADIDTYVPIANQQATEIMQLQATNKTLLDALRDAIETIEDAQNYPLTVIRLQAIAEAKEKVG